MPRKPKGKCTRSVEIILHNYEDKSEKWTIEFHRRGTIPKDRWGDCCKRKKIIRVREDLSPQNFLDTLIHEIRHAQHPVLFEAEDFITRTSTEIAEAIILSGLVTIDTKRKK